MTSKRAVGILAVCCLALIGHATPATSPTQSVYQGACTSFCLDNGDHCIFGANQDNQLEIGMLFVNKRYVAKTAWDPDTSGQYGRWVSKYGSLTINFVGYQMPWGGINEAGLMISTMALPETQGPEPDERPPFEGPFWMQYQLDNHSSVQEVINSERHMRLTPSAVDHYLVCDRSGACATIEFIEGKPVYHTGESLPVKVLTNSPYRVSLNTWEEQHLHANLRNENSLWRFTEAANRTLSFEPSTSDAAVTYAFDTLEAVSRPDTVWSFVYDPANLRVYFRTRHNPAIRYLDLSKLDFSCSTPASLLDVHADLSGDVSDRLTTYSHKVSLDHSLRFFTGYEGMSLPPFVVNVLVRGVESFPCVEDVSPKPGLTRYRPLLAPKAMWGGRALLDYAWPIWIPLVVLSLAFVIWRLAAGRPTSPGRRLAWVLVTLLLGPFALLAFLLTRRKRRDAANAP